MDFVTSLQPPAQCAEKFTRTGNYVLPSRLIRRRFAVRSRSIPNRTLRFKSFVNRIFQTQSKIFVLYS
jgi:hypothetical protein